jgi:hypothetical protein
MTTPHYVEAFHAAVGRCFRFVSIAGAHGQPTHCPAPSAWQPPIATPASAMLATARRL